MAVLQHGKVYGSSRRAGPLGQPTMDPTKRRHGYRKVCRRVNAGRSDRIAFHQSIHSDIGLARSVVTNDAVTRGLTMPALNLA